MVRPKRGKLKALQLAQLEAMSKATAVASEAITLGSRAEMRVTEYSSPLPPPQYLDEYEQRLPGLARALVDDALAQRAHARALETQKVSNVLELGRQREETERFKVKGALAVGVAVALVVAAIGIWGHPVPATALAAVDALGLGLFFKKRGEKKE